MKRNALLIACSVLIIGLSLTIIAFNHYDEAPQNGAQPEERSIAIGVRQDLTANESDTPEPIIDPEIQDPPENGTTDNTTREGRSRGRHPRSFDGRSTRFDQADLRNVPDLTLEIEGKARIRWHKSKNIENADLDRHITFGKGWVSVDSAALPELSDTATVTVYDLEYRTLPVIYRDGIICDDCRIQHYIGGDLTFDVSHFSNYTTGPNTNLSIRDSGEGSYVNVTDTVTFYANYTNVTTGALVAGASCAISFGDGTSASMSEGTVYTATRAYNTTGTKTWNVTCSATGYETLDASDTITINESFSISTCRDLSTAGSYTLTSNLLTNTSNCININVSNVLLDCAGKSISGNKSTNVRGVYAYAILNNVTVTNCDFSLFDEAIYFVAITNGIIANTTASHSSIGFRINGGSGNRMNNVTSTNSTYGIQILSTATNNTLANSTFNSTQHGLYIYGSAAANNTFINNSFYASNTGATGYEPVIIESPGNLFIDNTNDRAYTGTTVRKFYSNMSQSTSSYGNTGWWPLIASNGSDATTQGMTAWYNGTLGGRYANGTANPNNKQWFGNKPDGCIGATQTFTCGETVTESCTLNANMTSDRTCLTVGANNVAIDCAGYSLTGNNSNASIGIYSTKTNTTVRNCLINGFDSGIYFNGASNGTIENNSINTTTNYTLGTPYSSGIFLFNGANNNLVNNTSSQSQFGQSAVIWGSSNNRITNFISVSTESYGIHLESSSNNSITNSNFTSENGVGIYIYSGLNNSIINSRGISNTQRGIYLDASSNNIIRDSSGFSNTNDAIRVYVNCNNNQIINTNGTSINYTGVYIAGSSNNTLSNVLGSSETREGIYLSTNANNNRILDSIGSSNSSHGIRIDASYNNSINNSDGISNSNYGIFIYTSSNNNITYSSGTSNTSYGIRFASTSNNNIIVNSTFNSSTNYGIYLAQSYNNLFINCSNALHYNGSGQKFYSEGNASANTSSYGNLGWWPLIASNGSDVTTQSMTAWYNGTTGGRYANGTANPNNKQWFGNKPDGCIGATQTFTCGETVTESCTLNTNMTSDRTCLTIGANNIVIDGAGFTITGNLSSSGRGIFASYLNNITVRNLILREWDTGIFIQSGANSSIVNCTLNSSSTTGSGILMWSTNGLIENNTVFNAQNIAIYALATNVIVRGNNISGVSYIYTVCTNCTITDNRLFGLEMGTGTYNSTFSNNVITYTIRASNDLSVVQGNRIINNTLLYVGNTIWMPANASNNIFCLNNFSATTGFYINDTNGSNSYNCTYDGKNQGNIYPNVLSGAVTVMGVTPSSKPGLYIGLTGGGVPYNNVSSQGKIIGYAVDYAPLTPNGTNGCVGATRTFGCGETVNESCTLNGSMTSDRTCFTIGANNVAIDCAGYSLTGNNSNASIGIYSTKTNTTVRNCIINNFDVGIDYNGSSNGTIENNNINTGAAYSTNGLLLYTSNMNIIVNNTVANCSYTALILDMNANYNNVTRNNLSSSTHTILLSSADNYLAENILSGVGNSNALLMTYLYSNSLRNRIMNNTMRSSGTAIRLNYGDNNSFSGNTITGQTGIAIDGVVRWNNLTDNRINSVNAMSITGGNDNLFRNITFNSSSSHITISAGNYTFCLNNFSATTGAYINDTNGSNSYNCTYDGKNQGNIYPNVLNNSVKVWGTTASSIPGLYVGVVGGGVPYSNSTSQGKITGNAIDYAPLTYNQTSGCVGSTQVFSCGQNITESCTMHNDAAINGSTCFQINTSNVVLDCRGRSVQGNLTSDTYGIYVISASVINNITIKNCAVSAFQRAIMAYGGNNNGVIENNTVSNFSEYGIIALSQNYIVRENIANGTSSQSGIGVFSANITVINNTLNGPLIGAINGARECTIENNTLYRGYLYMNTNYGQSNITNNIFKNNIIHNSTYGIYILSSNGSTFINNTIINGSIYIQNSHNHTFINNTNDLEYNGLTQKFTSNSPQSVSSNGNHGWWPKLTSNGSDVGGQTNTSWYNGSSGGRNADGSANSTLMYWYNNIPLPYISYSATSAITASSAVITWTTNVNTNSSVSYGPTTALGATTGQNDAVTSHSATLPYLAPLTTYHYNITSCTDTCYTVGPYNFTTNGPPTLWNSAVSTLTGRNWSDENLYFSFNVTSNSSGAEVAHYETMTSLKKNGQETLLVSMPFSQGDNGTFARNWRGANGTVINATYNQTGGVDGTGGYDPDGNDFIYLSLPSQSYSAFSWGGWYRRTYGGGYMSTLYGVNQTTIEFGYISGAVVVGIYNGSWCYPISATLNDDQWHQIYVVYEQGIGIKEYLDTTEYASTGNGCDLSRALSLTMAYPISYVMNAGQDNNGLNGSVDDFRIYNTSLTAEQIRAMYWEKKDVYGGLMNEWAFDRNSTTQEDTGTNDDLGTVTNATFTTSGKGRGAFAFEPGVRSRIDTTADMLNTTNHTVSVWIKPHRNNDPTYGSYSTVVGSSSLGGIYRILIGTSKILVDVGNGSGNWESADNITYGGWNHVVYTYNTTHESLYLNGIYQGLSPENNAQFTNLKIGYYGDTNYYFYNGTIDEVRIYNRSLSASEIGLLYNRSYDKHTIADSMTSPGDTWSACYISSNYEATSNETCSNNITISNAYQLTLTNTTITALSTRNWSDENIYFDFNTTSTRRQAEEAAHYETMTSLTKNGKEQLLVSLPFSYGDNNTAARNWRGANATVIGAIYNETGGVDGTGGYEADGNDFMFVSVPSQDYTAISWGGWFKRNGGWWANSMFGGSTGERYWITSTYFSGNDFAVRVNNGSWCFLTPYYPLSTSEWHHVMVVYETNKSIRTYIDGVEYISNGNGCAINIPIAVSNIAPFSYNQGAGQDNKGLNGSIDDFRVYNTSLTAEQVRAMYWEKKDVRNGLVAEWTFDRNSTTQEDTSTNNNTGILTNDPAWTESGYGRGAYSFNGSATQYVSANIDDFVGAHTMAFWFKANNIPSGYHDLVGTQLVDTNRVHLASTDGSIIWINPAGGPTIDSGIIPAIGRWYHVIATWNGTNATLYVDGNYRVSTSFVAAQFNITNVIVGSAAEGFNGTIDEVRLYNRSLNATEAGILYNRSYDKHTIVDSMTSPGDIWRACYISAAGTNTTSEVCSGNITLPNAYQLTLTNTTISTLSARNWSDENIYFDFNVTSTRRQAEEAAHYETLTSLTKNGKEQLLVSLPFSYGDNNTVARNYRGSNAAVTNAIYNETGGVDGTGGYESDGNYDYIQTVIATGNYSALSWGGWYKTMPNGDSDWVATIRGISSQGYHITSIAQGIGSSNETITLQLYNGSWCSAVSNVPVSSNEWHHIIAVYERYRRTSIYVDGVEYTTSGGACSLDATISVTEAYPISYVYGANQENKGHNGSIDDFRVYNTSLTTEQVRAMYWEKKDIRNGLVGEWTFDKNSTSQDDTSTNNNTATPQKGAEYTPNGYGKGAYTFNGINQSMRVSSGATPIQVGTNDFTLGAWIKTGSSTAGPIILGSYNIYPIWYIRLASGSGAASARIGYNTSLNYEYSGGALANDAWHHVIATYDRDQNMTLYVDGVRIVSGNISGLNNIDMTTTNMLEIGSVSGGSAYFFNGTIDEVRIYNRSLNASEVGLLYNRSYDKHTIVDSMTAPGDTWSACYISAAGTNTSSEVCSGNITLPNAYQLTLNSASLSSLLDQNRSNESAYFTFNVTSTRRESEEAAHYETMTSLTKNGQEQLILSMPFSYGDNSTTARNWRGTNGVVSGATVYNDTGGVDGTGAYEFDGIDDIISATINTNTQFENQTLSLWLKAKQSSAGGINNVFARTQGNNGYWAFINNNLRYGSGFCINAPMNINETEWHHFVTTTENNIIYAYIDGAQLINVSANETNCNFTALTAVSIGRYSLSSSLGFNGSIDDVKLFNTSLTAEQVRQLYWEKKDVRNGLGAEWTFDNNATKGEDTSTNNNTLNTSVTATWIPQGYARGAYSINESNTVPYAENHPSLNPGLGNWAISTWFYSNTTFLWNGTSRNDYVIFRKSADVNNTFYIRLRNSDIIQFYRTINGTGYSAGSTANVSAGIWHHLVFILNRSNDRLLTYVDNRLYNGEIMNLSGVDLANTGPFQIGPFTDGKLDEFRIYNRTLSDVEIGILYNRSYEKHALAATQTQEGDTWSACYVSSAGTNISSEVCSNSLYFPDYTAPTVTITPANNIYLATNTTNLTAIINDEGGLQNVTLIVRNNTGSIHYTNSNSYTGRNQSANITRNVTLQDGVYTQVWTSYDLANRTTTVNYTFTIDTALPNIIVNDPANNSPVRTEFIINTTVAERNLKNLTYTWNGTTRTLYDDSLVLMYNFDNVSAIGENDTMMKDASQYGNDGSCTECPIGNGGGRYNNAYSFNTTNRINVSNENLPNFSGNDFTVSAWIYEYTPVYRATIVGKKEVSGTAQANGWALISDSGRFKLYFGNGTNTSAAVHNSLHNNEVWYHVVATWNASNRTATLYIDSVRETLNTASQNFTYVPIPYSLGIGSSTGDYAANGFNGSIDEVRIYNRTLSAAEIEFLYRSNLRKYDTDKWELIVNQTNVSINTAYNFSIASYDRALNQGTSGTYTVTGSSGPIIQSTANTPTLWDDLDPDTNITITATITDPQGDFNTILLQWKNATSDWNNVTMTNTTPYSTATTFTASFIPGTESNITYRIFANDSTGITGTSANTTIPVVWDCTWRLSSEYLGETAGYDEVKSIGNITVENTGDAQHASNNCTLGIRLTYDLNEGRIYFDNSYIKPSDTYSINAKTNRTITINASFLAEIREETAIISVTDLYARSNRSQENASAILISTTGGPYLYERISSAPISVYLTTQNITIDAYTRNIMGDGAANTTAYNVTAAWSFPAGSVIISGNITNAFENISDNTERDLEVVLDFNVDNLPSMTPGTKEYTLSVTGYDLDGDIIEHSDNRTTISETAEIVFICYATSDGVRVQACGTLDPDNTVEAEQSSGGGGGGGGGGRGSGGGTVSRTTEERESIFNTTATYSIARGKDDSFTITMENPFPDELIDVSINVTGLLSKYLRIQPSNIPALKPGAKVNYTVTITAPAYFSEGDHELLFTISGALFRQEQRGETTITTISHVIDERRVLLKILEIPDEDADEMLKKAQNLLDKMKNAGFNTASAQEDLAALESAHASKRYGLLNDLLTKMEERYKQATQTKDRIDELHKRIAWAKERLVSTTQSERAIYLSQTAFDRGDYQLALERIKEAELIYATEVKGEIPLQYYYQEYKRQLWTTAALLLLSIIGAVYASKRALLNHRIKELHKEEGVILGLIKQAQHECFEKKSTSIEEYNETIQQYEQRLAHTITEQISAETKKQHMLSLEPKHIRLEKEREKIMERVKELQHSYISLGGVETRVYEQRMKSLAERVAEIDEERAMDIARRALRKARFRRVKQ